MLNWTAVLRSLTLCLGSVVEDVFLIPVVDSALLHVSFSKSDQCGFTSKQDLDTLGTKYNTPCFTVTFGLFCSKDHQKHP